MEFSTKSTPNFLSYYFYITFTNFYFFPIFLRIKFDTFSDSIQNPIISIFNLKAGFFFSWYKLEMLYYQTQYNNVHSCITCHPDISIMIRFFFCNLCILLNFQFKFRFSFLYQYLGFLKMNYCWNYHYDIILQLVELNYYVLKYLKT